MGGGGISGSMRRVILSISGCVAMRRNTLKCSWVVTRRSIFQMPLKVYSSMVAQSAYPSGTSGIVSTFRISSPRPCSAGSVGKLESGIVSSGRMTTKNRAFVNEPTGFSRFEQSAKLRIPMKSISIQEEAVALHAKLRGKIRVEPTTEIRNAHDLSLVYTPGVGEVSRKIAEDPALVDALTWRKNTVAIISDGTAVLGLGDIGPEAAIPVLEGKSAIFKRFSDIDAIPLVLNTKDPKEIIETVIRLSPSFGAIQLEDISAPRCFEIERELIRALSIPVMHDDQHGTAIVVLAGLLNALRVAGKKIEDISVRLNGAGAAGVAIADILIAVGVSDLILFDRNGAIYEGREALNPEKERLAKKTNLQKRTGSLAELIAGSDVLIGVSAPGAFTPDMIRSMNPRSIIFALANPLPEILPDEAKRAGALVVATGRSDFPNQVNNALCYPGLFRGMLDSGVKEVTEAIKIRAAKAIAESVESPSAEQCIPSIFAEGLHDIVAKSVPAE